MQQVCQLQPWLLLLQQQQQIQYQAPMVLPGLWGVPNMGSLAPVPGAGAGSAAVAGLVAGSGMLPAVQMLAAQQMFNTLQYQPQWLAEQQHMAIDQQLQQQQQPPL